MKFLIVLAAVVALAVAQQTDSNSINPPNCGERPLKTRNKIVGGQEAVPGDWGWQIVLLNYGGFSCGGSLINSQWVLTAAHCVGRNTNPSTYQVVIGAHNRLFAEEGKVTKNVIKVIPHPQYTSWPSTKNDVALLKLESPVDYTDRIVPVCIDNGSLNYEGAKAVTTGWGALSQGGSVSATKQEVEVDILAESHCTRGYGSNYNHKVEVCSGVIGGGKDACQGDSGGPLVTFNPTTAKYESYGVTSWGRGCAQDGYPGIYARTSAFYNWIVDNVRDN